MLLGSFVPGNEASRYRVTSHPRGAAAYFMRVTSYSDVALCPSSSQILATPLHPQAQTASMLARFARSGSQSHPPPSSKKS